jgi:hypothetical protein
MFRLFYKTNRKRFTYPVLLVLLNITRLIKFRTRESLHIRSNAHAPNFDPFFFRQERISVPKNTAYETIEVIESLKSDPPVII